MSVHVPRSQLPRGLRDVAENARRAAQAALKVASNPSREERRESAILRESKKAPRHEHGSRIYVFHHLQKNHIVYSLDKIMKNNAALTQLPFNGKKTIPSALRKDLWSPFAMVQFPEGQSSLGLTAFRQLREYRRRHELEWGDEIFYKQQTAKEIAEEKPRVMEEFKIRGRKICDQKANSVADLAAVLGNLGKEKKKVKVKARGGRGYAERARLAAKEEEEAAIANAEEGEEGPKTRATVYWRSLDDAEFAPEWSEDIEHGQLAHLNQKGFVRPEHLAVEEEEAVEDEEGTSEEGVLAAGEEAKKPVVELEAEPSKPKSKWKLF